MAALLNILQWNAQGMHGHGQELLHFLNNSTDTYQVICIQETWYEDNRIMLIPNYVCLYRNRINQQRGGCAFYIHESLGYASYAQDIDVELQRVIITCGKEKIVIVNFYNPCKQLDDNIMELIYSYTLNYEYIILGDFNAHNTL